MKEPLSGVKLVIKVFFLFFLHIIYIYIIFSKISRNKNKNNQLYNKLLKLKCKESFYLIKMKKS